MLMNAGNKKIIPFIMQKANLFHISSQSFGNWLYLCISIFRRHVFIYMQWDQIVWPHHIYHKLSWITIFNFIRAYFDHKYEYLGTDSRIITKDLINILIFYYLILLLMRTSWIKSFARFEQESYINNLR